MPQEKEKRRNTMRFGQTIEPNHLIAKDQSRACNRKNKDTQGVKDKIRIKKWLKKYEVFLIGTCHKSKQGCKIREWSMRKAA